MGDPKGFVKGSFKGSIRVQGLRFTVGFRGFRRVSQNRGP